MSASRIFHTIRSKISRTTSYKISGHIIYPEGAVLSYEIAKLDRVLTVLFLRYPNEMLWNFLMDIKTFQVLVNSQQDLDYTILKENKMELADIGRWVYSLANLHQGVNKNLLSKICEKTYFSVNSFSSLLPTLPKEMPEDLKRDLAECKRIFPQYINNAKKAITKLWAAELRTYVEQHPTEAKFSPTDLSITDIQKILDDFNNSSNPIAPNLTLLEIGAWREYLFREPSLPHQSLVLPLLMKIRQNQSSSSAHDIYLKSSDTDFAITSLLNTNIPICSIHLTIEEYCREELATLLVKRNINTLQSIHLTCKKTTFPTLLFDAIAEAPCVTTITLIDPDRVYDSVLLKKEQDRFQEVCRKNLAEAKKTFAMGFHHRAGAESSILTHFKRNPLYDHRHNLDSLIGSFMGSTNPPTFTSDDKPFDLVPAGFCPSPGQKEEKGPGLESTKNLPSVRP